MKRTGIFNDIFGNRWQNGHYQASPVGNRIRQITYSLADSPSIDKLTYSLADTSSIEKLTYSLAATPAIKNITYSLGGIDMSYVKVIRTPASGYSTVSLYPNGEPDPDNEYKLCIANDYYDIVETNAATNSLVDVNDNVIAESNEYWFGIRVVPFLVLNPKGVMNTSRLSLDRCNFLAGGSAVGLYTSGTDPDDSILDGQSVCLNLPKEKFPLLNSMTYPTGRVEVSNKLSAYLGTNPTSEGRLTLQVSTEGNELVHNIDIKTDSGNINMPLLYNRFTYSATGAYRSYMWGNGMYLMAGVYNELGQLIHD